MDKEKKEYVLDENGEKIPELDENGEQRVRMREKNGKLYCTTILRDFKGTVRFIVKEEIPDKEYGVHVVGQGVNKKTGEPFNFITSQTSL